MLAANIVARYSVTIGLYLGGMGLGALLCNKIFKGRQSWDSLFKVEILLSITGGLSVAVIHFAHMIYSFIYYQNVGFKYDFLVFFIPSFIVIILVGFFTGLELPLLVRIGNELSVQRKITNRILGIDYIGALAGAVAFPLLLLPYLEVITISFITAILNLIIALLIIFGFLKSSRRYILRASIGILLFSYL